MSLSRNLWSVLIVASAVAVGTLVLVLNRDDPQTTFSKRVVADPFGVLAEMGTESSTAKSQSWPSLERQRLISSVVFHAFQQDRKLTQKVIREQMTGATRTVAVFELIKLQMQVGDVVPAMDNQLLISDDSSLGLTAAGWIASAVGTYELPSTKSWLASLKAKNERKTVFDNLAQSFQKTKNDGELFTLFLEMSGELEDWRRRGTIEGIASLRHMKGDTAGLNLLRESVQESDREWVDVGMLNADAMQPRESRMARAAKLTRARYDAISRIISGEVEKDAHKAADYVMSLPDQLFPNAMNALGNDWRLKDVESYAAWIRALPSGPRREQAIESFVTLNRGQREFRPIAREIAKLAADPAARERLESLVR